ncbi:MAG TPA: nucleotidyltransferase family protein [Blastocatellia bacterium]|nr:nucleotidyltransferase family protein [Blastocatellia bacterium]
MITALLLAAGESVRMGAFKQLLPIAGKSFVECCVDTLLASRVDEVLVVTGHRSGEVMAALGARPVRFVHNAAYREGMSSSLMCGVKALSGQTQAAVIALVDQPTIEVAAVNAIIDQYLVHQPLIVVPTFGGRNGHPVLLDMRLKDEILATDPNLGLRQVVHAHADETLHVEIHSESILRDFDYPEDYEKLNG